MDWDLGDRRLGLDRVRNLGILNLTPDSFSDGGRFLDPRAAALQARRLWEAGADILDLGAESTRPGAAPPGEARERARLEPVLALLAAPERILSLDTRHASVARFGLERGVCILNDVTGFRDPAMVEAAQGAPCGLIAMRSRMAGGAFLMPPYGGQGARDADLALEELRALRDRLLASGIARDRILLDPGFGFGTTFEEDEALWKALPRLPEALDWPVERFCIGISRKRFLAWRAGTPALPPGDRDGLTAQAHREAQALGFRVFRTHDPGWNLSKRFPDIHETLNDSQQEA